VRGDWYGKGTAATGATAETDNVQSQVDKLLKQGAAGSISMPTVAIPASAGAGVSATAASAQTSVTAPPVKVEIPRETAEEANAKRPIVVNQTWNVTSTSDPKDVADVVDKSLRETFNRLRHARPAQAGA
jgi:hypothetical protein